MNLGAVQSKCAHVANTLLPPAMLQELQTIFLAKGVTATTAIEGNSMSEREVREIIEGRATIPPSRDYERQEILNIVSACNAIVETINVDASGALSFDEFCELNRKVLHRLPRRKGEIPGEIPTHNLTVGRYRGAPREDCEYLLRRLCDWINSDDWLHDDENKLAYGVLRAAIAHLYFAWIHPFSDGNGRTARLVEFKILLGAGAPLPAAHLLSSHYNQTRLEYYRQLDFASASGGDLFAFLDYAVRGMADGLQQQIDHLNSHQWNATWKEHVYSQFESQGGKAAHRQRQVALDLWRFGPTGVEISKLRSISPDVAARYARVSAQAIVRDIKILEGMGLVERRKKDLSA
ncbi:MAG TPA: Fic family protein [Planctomycetaceae bacterium]|nr:Fic family protein [Planctomycetaceae bacterium]